MSTLNVLRNLFLTVVLILVASLGACTSTPDAQPEPSSSEPGRSAMYGELEQETENYPAWSEKQQANSDFLAPEMSQSPYLDANKQSRYSKYSKSKLRMSKASKRSSEKVALSRQGRDERSKKRRK